MLVYVGCAGEGTEYLKEPSRARAGLVALSLGGDGALRHSAGPYSVGRNPTYLAQHAGSTHGGLLVTSETADSDENSSVWSVAIDDPATGALRVVNSVDAGGRACCQLAMHPSGGLAACANYVGEASDPSNRGTFAIRRVASDGRLLEQTAHAAHALDADVGNRKGKRDSDRQDTSHAHAAMFAPLAESGRNALLVCDLGCDRIFQYIVDASGAVRPNAVPSVASHQLGSGPRHLALCPAAALPSLLAEERLVCVANELDSTVEAFRYSPDTGRLCPWQVVSTLPSEHASSSNCAAIKFHPSGKFLYVSNRGHDSIAVFEVGHSGLVWRAFEMTGGYGIGGMGPRDFDLSPCGRWLVLANQDTDTVVSYAVDSDSGLLRRVAVHALTAPVCVRIISGGLEQHIDRKRPIHDGAPAPTAEAEAPAKVPRGEEPPPPGRRRFAGDRVLVTGGAMGIGRGIAEAFAAEGATVVVADIQEPPAGHTVRFIRCDASNAEDIARCCQDAGPIDVLVNNVAVQPEGPCHEHTLEQWNKAIAINLTSYFLFAKHLVPHMLKAGRGAIVNIGSVQGTQSQPSIPGYAASKGGVLSLTRQLAIEYAAKGIRVNSVSPGTIGTPLVEGILRKRGTTRAQAGAVYPMKRIGETSEVAKAVLFLASDDASFVTAENLHVDGGIMGLGGWAQVA